MLKKRIALIIIFFSIGICHGCGTTHTESVADTTPPITTMPSSTPIVVQTITPMPDTPTPTLMPTNEPYEVEVPDYDWWWLKDMYPDIEYDQIICFVSAYGTSVVTFYVAWIDNDWKILAYCYG